MNKVIMHKAATVQVSTYGENVTLAQVHVSPSTRPDDRKKGVHFESFCTFTAPISAVDDADASNLWWDKGSLDNRRATDKHLVFKNSRRENPAFHDSIQFLMKSYKTNTQCRQKLMERVEILRDADVRGLEQRIVPKLKEMRSSSVKEVLQLQRKLRGESFTRSEIKANMLRQKSLKLSRAARQLAFRLAQADRLEAKEIYGAMDNPIV